MTTPLQESPPQRPGRRALRERPWQTLTVALACVLGSGLLIWSAYTLLVPSRPTHATENRPENDEPARTTDPGAQTKPPLVLGMSAPFRGSSRELGIQLFRGSMAYFQDVNDHGGIDGRKIVLKLYDDGYEPVPAIRNTRKLVEEDKVSLLYGYVGTAPVTRVLPLLKKYNDQRLFLFFPLTGAEPHRQPPYAEYVFNLRASYQDETRQLVDRFVDLGRKKIAIFYQIDAYGRSGWDGVRAALQKHGLNIVAEATYKRGAPFTDSFQPQVEILRQANPDAVISVGAYAACAGFIRDVRDAGWNVPIANISFVGSEELLRLLAGEGQKNGQDYAANLINSQVVPSYDQDLPAVKEYRRLIDQYNPMLPAGFTEEGYQPLQYSFISFEGFLDAKLLVEILKRDPADPRGERLRQAAESLHGGDSIDLGIGGNVRASLDQGKHQALNQVYFTQVKEGRFVLLKDGDWQRWRQ